MKRMIERGRNRTANQTKAQTKMTAMIKTAVASGAVATIRAHDGKRTNKRPFRSGPGNDRNIDTYACYIKNNDWIEHDFQPLLLYTCLSYPQHNTIHRDRVDVQLMEHLDRQASNSENDSLVLYRKLAI